MMGMMFNPDRDRNQADLRAYFESRLEGVEAIQLTEMQYQQGAEGLPDNLGQMVKDAIGTLNTWRANKLCNQDACKTFFQVACELGKIEIINAHPRFPIGVKVFIKELDDGEWINRFVPATKTCVGGDGNEHVFILDEDNRKCCIVHTSDLDSLLIIRPDNGS